MRSFSDLITDIRGKRAKPVGFDSLEKSEDTPPANRGCKVRFNNDSPNSYTCSWGYFTASFSPDFLDPVLALLSKEFSAQFVESRGANFYRYGFRAEGGLFIDCDNVHDGQFRVQIPAGYLESVHPSRLAGFVWALNSFAPHLSRFDATVDVVGYGTGSPQSVTRAMKAEEIYPVGFRHNNWDYRDSTWKEEGGWTFYLGVRKHSSVFLRLYDQHGPNRWEAELHDEKARDAWFQFSCAVAGEGTEDTVAQTIAGIVFGCVTFKSALYKDTCSNPVAPFYQRILDGLDATVIKLQHSKERKNESIARKLAWFRQQCLRTIAQIKYAFADQDPYLLDNLIHEAYLNLTEEDKAFSLIPEGDGLGGESG
jgi:hypothetical protein